MADLQVISNHKKLDVVFKMLCDYCGKETDEVKTRTRNREVVVVRQKFYYIARKFLSGITSSEVGRFLKYDHATVLHGVNTIEQLMDSDKAFAYEMNSLIDYYKDYIQHKVEAADPNNIPSNKLQKLKLEKAIAERRANKMYYIAKKLLNQFHKEVNDSKIIEGYKSYQLEIEYIEALKELEKVKNLDYLTIN